MKHNNVLCFLKLDFKIKPCSQSPIPPCPHRKASVSGYNKVRGKHQLEEPEKTANILWRCYWFFPQNDVWGMSTEIPYWWGVTTKNWVVFLMVKSKTRCMTNHKHYPDLGSAISLVWNFCTCFSYVISWGNQCKHWNMGRFLRSCVAPPFPLYPRTNHVACKQFLYQPAHLCPGMYISLLLFKVCPWTKRKCN